MPHRWTKRCGRHVYFCFEVGGVSIARSVRGARFTCRSRVPYRHTFFVSCFVRLASFVSTRTFCSPAARPRGGNKMRKYWRMGIAVRWTCFVGPHPRPWCRFPASRASSAVRFSQWTFQWQPVAGGEAALAYAKSGRAVAVTIHKR